MNITVVKEGNVLRILHGAADIADGTRLVVVPRSPGTGYSADEAVQLESIFAETEEDWSTDLAPFRADSRPVS
ncbi:MAG: hypothetical protein ACKVYV_00725 [Limisphaerales bacterium]